MRAAIEASSLTRQQKRGQLIDEMHDKALDLLGRCDEPHEEFKVTKLGVERIVTEKPTAAAVKAHVDSVHQLYGDIRRPPRWLAAIR